MGGTFVDEEKVDQKAKQPLLGSHKKHHAKKGSHSFAIFCTALVALGPISFGYSLGYSSPIQDDIIKSLGLSLPQYAFFGSLVNLGAMIGAAVSGHVADYFGRKGALVVASVPHILGWLLTAFAEGPHTLFVARFLVGIGVGIISFGVPVYIAEISPRHLRGTLGAVNQLAVTIGIVLSYFGGLFLEWRMLAGVGVLPCSLLLIGLLFIPESPRFLAKSGAHDADLVVSLQSLRGKDCDISGELYEIKSAVEESKTQPKPKFSDLKEKRICRPLLIGVGLQILQQFSGINAIMFYASAILASAGLKDPNIGSLGLALIQVIFTAVAAGLMDKAGRRLLLMISGGGMAVSAFLVSFSFYLKDELREGSSMGTFVSYLSLLSLVVYIIAFSLGMGAIPWILMAEIFPANVRGLAGSLATLTNWSSGWAVTLCFNYMMNWSSAGVFFLFAAECLITVVFVAIFVPETRGRTLEEIEAFFK